MLFRSCKTERRQKPSGTSFPISGQRKSRASDPAFFMRRLRHRGDAYESSGILAYLCHRYHKSAQVQLLETSFMKNYASLKNLLLSFDDERKEKVGSFPSPHDREVYANKIAECFIPCAKKILAGHFEVKYKVGKDVLIRKIQPTVLELYYHEEKYGGFRDPIMYHTDYRKRTEKKAKGETYFSLSGLTELPYYPIGS